MKEDLRKLRALEELKKKPTRGVGDVRMPTQGGVERKLNGREKVPIEKKKKRKVWVVKKDPNVEEKEVRTPIVVAPCMEKKRVEKKGEFPKVVEGQVLVAMEDDEGGDWVFDSRHSYHICADKKKFTRWRACDERVTLPNGEEVEVEAIGEVHLRMHNGIERRFGGVRYIPKLKRNTISLRRLEMRGCTIKTCDDGVLSVARGNLVLLRGLRKSNQYVLQCEGRGQGVVEVDARSKSPRRVTFAEVARRPPP